MGNAGNQIRNKMINSHPKTDRAKLVGLRKFLRDEIPGVIVHLEPHMMFTKGEDQFVGWDDSLTEEEVKTYTTHPPDVILYLPDGEMMVLELDGAIHDEKVEKTRKRDLRCILNNILFVVVNESDLKFELGIAKSALLPQEEINKAFLEKINQIISKSSTQRLPPIPEK